MTLPHLGAIANEIASEQYRIRRDRRELESRLRESVDWRSYSDRRPFSVVGIAFVGGIVFGAWTAGSERINPNIRPASEHLKAALIATGVAMLRECFVRIHNVPASSSTGRL